MNWHTHILAMYILLDAIIESASEVVIRFSIFCFQFHVSSPALCLLSNYRTNQFYFSSALLVRERTTKIWKKKKITSVKYRNSSLFIWHLIFFVVAVIVFTFLVWLYDRSFDHHTCQELGLSIVAVLFNCTFNSSDTLNKQNHKRKRFELLPPVVVTTAAAAVALALAVVGWWHTQFLLAFFLCVSLSVLFIHVNIYFV